MEKDFYNWNELKQGLNQKPNAPNAKQREIWWCSVGVNVGYETDGKGEVFSRPVLVIRKFNSRVFLGVPLTTKMKKNPYYHKISFRDKNQCAMILQIRLWDSKRLTSRMGQLSKKEFESVREAVKKMI